jgi:cytoskeletal protein CcmA (bactofilin family)
VKDTARVIGNISAPTISIVEGACFTGNIDMNGKPAVTQSAPAERARPARTTGNAA